MSLRPSKPVAVAAAIVLGAFIAVPSAMALSRGAERPTIDAPASTDTATPVEAQADEATTASPASPDGTDTPEVDNNDEGQLDQNDDETDEVGEHDDDTDGVGNHDGDHQNGHADADDANQSDSGQSGEHEG